MNRRQHTFALLAALAGATALTACAGGARPDPATPAPVAAAAGAQRGQPVLDSLWTEAEAAYRRGKWTDAQVRFERYLLEAGGGDPRAARGRFFVGESKLAAGQALEAARDFRRVSDEMPNDPLAPDALLRVGDAYAELWRRPELDPSYGQSAIATYQEVVSRYPDTDAARRAQLRTTELNDWFATKQYKAALYYYRLKAYDSAILYLKDLVATYPRAEVAPAALLKLVEAYGVLGYREDAAETCGYLRRFHPTAKGIERACSAGAGAPAPAAPSGS